MSNSLPGGIGGAQASDEFPTIREQDLAMILADWVRLTSAHEELKIVTHSRREPDALDFTILVAELSPALHSRSLEVLLTALPESERWTHLRTRLSRLLEQRRHHEFSEYPERMLPVF